MAHASPYFATLRSRKLGKFRSFKAALDQEAPRVVNEMLRERDWLGQTLLHEALVQHAPPHTIDELLSQYPSSAKAKTNRGERSRQNERNNRIAYGPRHAEIPVENDVSE